MSPVSFPMVDVADIVRLVGQASFGRGQDYARSGAVASFEWRDGDGRLRGVVQGTRPHPYSCFIEVVEASRGAVRPTRSTCECPMGGDCKHVAAVLVASNAKAARERATGGLSDIARSSAAAAGPSSWRTALTDLIGGDGTASDVAAPARTAMALQFALHEVRATGGPLVRDGLVREAESRRAPREERLGVRPVIRSETGNWVKGNVTWGNVVYQLNRLGLEPEHHRWFTQFPALHRTGPQVYRGDTEWLDIDDFASPLLWHLLEDAARVGVQFVGAKKHVAVTVAESADIALDARRDEDGSLRLSPAVTIDGRPVARDAVRLIGDHGLYSVESTGGGGGVGAGKPLPRTGIVLAPTATRLTAEQQRLLRRPAARIPADGVAEFLDRFYPVLRRNVRITSADDSVRFPEVALPTLVLTAAYRPKHVLRLTWHWEYRSGEATTRVPVAAPIGESPVRDPAAEQQLLDRAAAVLEPAGGAGGDWAGDGDDPGASIDPAAESVLQGIPAAEFTERVLPRLEALDGVRVDLDGTKPDYRELTATPTLTVTTVATDERDWFDLGVVVTVDGRQVPFGPLFTALAKGRKKLLLNDGSYLSLGRPMFDRLRELIEEARTLDEWRTGARISRSQASLWADFEDLADESQPAEAWRKLIAGLTDTDGVGATPPPGQLTATLRPYQLDGFRWLAFLFEHRLGGILADDMGLGKTLQTLALIAHARDETPPADRRPFLVVAPASVVPNWLSETARFTPGLTVAGITSTRAKSGTSVAEAAAGADVVVTSYALFRLDSEEYNGQEWAGLILDEAQFVKNSASVAHACARDLAAPFKLAITGTPMENNLSELWALFAIVAPGLFPSARRFAEHYQRPIERKSGVRAVAGIRSRSVEDEENAATERLAKLRRRIRPLMLRRTKEQVATELPPKQEQVLQIDLAPEHQALYDTFLQRERQKLLGLMEDLDRNRFIVFRSLTLLRLLSLDASLVDEQYAGVPSAKLDALLEQLEDVLAEGHRALVFSQFTSYLGRVGARLAERGIDYAYLDGSTRRRGEVIDGFKRGDAPVFLISLKAGGFGLNLTEADYVFLLDPWWNPAAEEQAVDRTHRIGQARNVMVYRMVAAGTIEEKVMALKERKARLFESVLEEGDAFRGALTAEDLRSLLGE